MRCRYITAREKKVAEQVARSVATEMVNDAVTRSEYLMIAAMYNSGLSKRTIDRVIKNFMASCEKYTDYVKDGIADDGLIADMEGIGFTPEELKMKL